MSGSRPEGGAYRAAAGEAEAELREKGSRFLAFLLPADSPAAAQAGLEALRRRFPDATHHCWAWRLGPAAEERSSDDGEPAGTAGVPMLHLLRGAERSDVQAVVVRWFGGTKLGKGGLARAYAGAVREALARLPVREHHPAVRLAVSLPYEKVGAVKRLIRPPEVELAAESYGAEVMLVLTVRLSARADLEAALADLGLRSREKPLTPAPLPQAGEGF